MAGNGPKRALVTGIAGQDGHYLTELLVRKGYEVHGIARAGSAAPQGTTRHECALEREPLKVLLTELQPDEIYHLAAQSSVARSFDDDFATFEANVLSTHAALTAFREAAPRARFYFAATSEMFGRAAAPQSEATPFDPVSPYAISKLAGYHLTKMHREAYGLFAASGILFNHESPLRPDTFVTQKIVRAAAAIARGEAKELVLGTLDARRDWGFAGDYVEAMWLMLQQPTPGDYVIGTGVSHSIKDILDVVFGALGLDWEQYVRTDAQFARPVELAEMRADASKAKRELGWEAKTSFEEMLKQMLAAAQARA